MTGLAFAYLQHRRLAGTTLAGRGKNERSASRTAALASLPAVRHAIIARLFEDLLPPVQCPCCQHRFRLPSHLKVPR